jgi:predicted ribosome quality control (RQC) complex YloA/Tae2 family protein
VDNLVLIRVAAALSRSLVGSVFQDAHQDGPRFRLIFLASERPRTIAISLEPDRPWVGRPAGRHRFPRVPPGRFLATLRRSLQGSVLSGLDKPPAEHRVALGFADGKTLMLELMTRRANLLLLDRAGVVLTAARRTRGRICLGQPYRPPPFPVSRVNPFGADAGSIDEALSRGGEEPIEALVRGFLGIGRTAAEILVRESRQQGRSVGQVAVERLEALGRGELDPVIEDEEDAGHGRLLPWPPAWPAEAPLRRRALHDPAETAGLYHDTVERDESERRRAATLLRVLETEIRRQRRVEAHVAADARAFESPERFRRYGEALLAGLAQATRVGGRVFVPDPYDAEGETLSIEVPPDRSLTQAAAAFFDRHRRAKRGLIRSQARAKQVAERRARLERLRERFSVRHEEPIAEALQRAMQSEGIPVALERTRAGKRAGVRTPAPRLEGVRLFASRDGDSVLVGKTGKDNDRLTFRLASPDDFWLHALGVRGAHVVVRNDARRTKPSAGSLTQAAGAAAWYSESREQPLVDVQWTRRKYVRRIRGAAPGTVRVKRSETVRVRPRRPPGV